MPGGAPHLIRINVYDISQANQYTTYAGVGIFHTGVEVFGREFAYGGHPENSTGIFATNRYEAPGPGEYSVATAESAEELLPSAMLFLSFLFLCLSSFISAEGGPNPQWFPFAVKFRQTIEIGLSRYTREEIDLMVQQLGKLSSRHTICFHFSNHTHTRALVFGWLGSSNNLVSTHWLTNINIWAFPHRLCCPPGREKIHWSEISLASEELQPLRRRVCF